MTTPRILLRRRMELLRLWDIWNTFRILSMPMRLRKVFSRSIQKSLRSPAISKSKPCFVTNSFLIHSSSNGADASSLLPPPYASDDVDASSPPSLRPPSSIGVSSSSPSPPSPSPDLPSTLRTRPRPAPRPFWAFPPPFRPLRLCLSSSSQQPSPSLPPPPLHHRSSSHSLRSLPQTPSSRAANRDKPRILLRSHARSGCPSATSRSWSS